MNPQSQNHYDEFLNEIQKEKMKELWENIEDKDREQSGIKMRKYVKALINDEEINPLVEF